jgi:hypothetical protein
MHLSRLFLFSGLFSLFLFSGSTSLYADYDASVSFSFNELNEYGEWVFVAGYGKVWRPYASHDWRPYYYGKWVWTSDGWLWDSDEPFGWISDHYGNWYYDDDWGWVWVPGYDYSPATVEWHVTDNEVGWLPLPPPALPGRVKVRSYSSWVFCPSHAFANDDWHHHVIVKSRPQPSAHVTVYHSAPRIEVIKRVSRAPVVHSNTKRVTVSSNNRSFVKVQSSSGQRTTKAVPVGVRYKTKSTTTTSRSATQGSVTVTKEEPEVETQKATVKVKNSSNRVITSPSRATSSSGQSKKSVTVSKSGEEEDEDNGNVTVQPKKKKIVVK